MKNNGRKAAVILAALIALSMVSCGGTAAEGTSESPKETTAAAAAADSTAAETEAAAETTAAADEAAPADTQEALPEMPEEDPPAEEEVKSPVLEEIGKIDGGSTFFYNDTCLYTGQSEESIECLDYLGNKVAGGEVPLVEKLDDTGLYSFCKKGDNIIYQGLMDAEGNIILDADQGVGLYKAINKRYIRAFFPEAETTDEKEAIYYVTANQFSFQPKENDTLYKGTVKVYDVETGKFLETTKANFDPNYMVYGDMIRFYDADNNLVYVSANDDKILDVKSGSTEAGEKFIITYEDGKNAVYDHTLTKLFYTDYNVMGLDGSSYYYRIMDSDAGVSGVMSAMGRIVIEPKYKNVYGLDETYFTYTTGDGSVQGLLKADGTEVTKEEYKTIRKVGTGLYCAKNSDNASVLLDKTGKILFTESGDDQLYALSGDTPYATIGGEYCYLVLSTGEFSLKISSTGSYFGNNILYSYKDKALYDVVTGETLIDGFDKAYTAYGYIYTFTGNEITVYKVN